MRKLTSKDVIKRFVDVHGDRYDYSRVVFKGTKDPVEIICRKHGIFEQAPQNHFKGCGCSQCGRDANAQAKKIEMHQFLERAHAFHADRYDYSRVSYRYAVDRISIRCPKHGRFQTTVIGHLTGRGCKKCGYESASSKQQQTKEYFVDKATAVHGDRYDYAKVVMRGNKRKVKIFCADHGAFLQTPSNHVNGKGCPQCGVNARALARMFEYSERFVEEAMQVHGASYDYTHTRYFGAHKYCTITCRQHGHFEQTPSSHLSGSGCPECSLEVRGATRVSRSARIFASRAVKIHKNKYLYTEFHYANANIPSIIICPDHGRFMQAASSHLSGRGCPPCSLKRRGEQRIESFAEQFEERSRSLHGDTYTYSSFIYSGANEKSVIVCRTHGTFWISPSAHLSGQGCPTCKESRYEATVRRWLENKRIRYIQEWRDHDCKVEKNLSFDFYIPAYGLIIEVDGVQHFETVNWNGRLSKSEMVRNLEGIQRRDAIKQDWAINNGFGLLRIKYDQDIDGCLDAIIQLLPSS